MFRFRQFAIDDSHCGMKLGTDSVALGAWTDANDCHRVIDLGAGCGVLSLMLAQRYPGLQIDAVEIDAAASCDCRLNFAHSPWAERLTVHCCGFDEYQPAAKVDLIISNPPYFVTGERAPRAQRAAARHESSMTVGAIMRYATDTLSATGSVALVLPADRAEDCIFQGELAGLKLRRHCRLSHRPGAPAIRSLLQLSRLDGPIGQSNLAVNSAEFASLTAAFYLRAHHSPGSTE